MPGIGTNDLRCQRRPPKPCPGRGTCPIGRPRPGTDAPRAGDGHVTAWHRTTFYRMPEAITAVTISQLSHRLAGRHRTRADGPDIEWTLTCGYGFWRTDRIDGIDLRVRRLGVRVPPSAPSSTAPSDHGRGLVVNGSATSAAVCL